MLTICDTHILIFWQDNPKRLSKKAKEAIESSLANKSLACADISLWEIAMLARSGRLRNDISIQQYLQDIILTMELSVLPITPAIANISADSFFLHKDPADRIIAATAIANNAPLISADNKLKKLPQLDIIC